MQLQIVCLPRTISNIFLLHWASSLRNCGLKKNHEIYPLNKILRYMQCQPREHHCRATERHVGRLKPFTARSPAPLCRDHCCVLCFCDSGDFRHLVSVELCSMRTSAASLFYWHNVSRTPHTTESPCLRLTTLCCSYRSCSVHPFTCRWIFASFPPLGYCE